MACKGVCDRYKAHKPVTGGRYEAGQKRCQMCEMFLNWEGLWCPCCSYRLRGKPRNRIYKEKLRAKIAGDIVEAVIETVEEDVIKPVNKLLKK